jgi:hypothetical protein
MFVVSPTNNLTVSALHGDLSPGIDWGLWFQHVSATEPATARN